MKLRLTICALAALLLAGATVADAAFVRVGRIVLRADGGFTPRTLPRHSYAPIDFQGHADIASTDSGPVPPLRRVKLDLDRDGRIGARGLAVCPPDRIDAAAPAAARRICRSALVGKGRVEATVWLPDSGPVEVRSPLSLFNGPRLGGKATILAHARAAFPSPETYVVVASIERRRGAFGYRVTFDVPEIAGGFGALTHVDAKIGRRYRAGGSKRSYLSGRCSDSILETRGRLVFGDGTVIEGTVFKPCDPR